MFDSEQDPESTLRSVQEPIKNSKEAIKISVIMLPF